MYVFRAFAHADLELDKLRGFDRYILFSCSLHFGMICEWVLHLTLTSESDRGRHLFVFIAEGSRNECWVPRSDAIRRKGASHPFAVTKSS